MIAGPLEENQQRFLAEYEKRCKSNLDESATSICRALDIDLSDFNRWQTQRIFVERFKELDLRILREQESAPEVFTVLDVPETPVSEPAKPQQSDAIPYDKIRKALPLLRDAKGWSVGKLGELTGINGGSIWCFETGRNKRLKNIDRLLPVFGCDSYKDMSDRAVEIKTLKDYGISKIVRIIRELHGLKPTELSDKIGVSSPNAINQIESGLLQRFHYVVKIQQALGYPTLTAMLEAVKQYEAANSLKGANQTPEKATIPYKRPLPPPPAKTQQSDAIPYDKIRWVFPHLRDAKGWGREDLAKRIGVSKKTLLFFENGNNKTLKNIDRLPQAFGCNSYDEMFEKAAEIEKLQNYGISKVVRVIRELHGLTQEELGKKIGRLRQGIYIIESGRLQEFHHVVDIQKALGYPTLTAMLEAVKEYEAAKAPSSSAEADGDSETHPGTEWREAEARRASSRGAAVRGG